MPLPPTPAKRMLGPVVSMLVACLACAILGGAFDSTSRAADPASASGKNGAVAAGAMKAVEAGIRILKADGNAADAAAATLLAMMITDYGNTASGGECSLLIFEAKSGEVKSLAGIGRAPLDPAAIEWYYANGIPAKGGMKAAPVPGEMHLIVTLLQRNGTKSLGEVMAPALELLDAGKEPWHAPLAVTFRKLVEAEQKAAGDRNVGSPGTELEFAL